MSEIARIHDKKHEANRKNSISMKLRTNLSQSTNSPVDRILFFQRTIGNHAVQKLIESGSLQTKLRIGQPGDVYEQEADIVAKRLMRIAELQVSKSIQRKCPLCIGNNGDRERKKKEDELFNIREVKGQTPKPKAEFNAMSVSGKHMTRSGMAFLEKDETAADDTEVDPRFLYQNGTTTCTFPAGTPSTVINNAGCSGTCTSRHEAVHAVDIGPCCAKAGAAHAAAATPAAKTAVENQFFTWMSSNRSWFECRAYAESVRCADEEINKKKCNIPPPADPACCNELAAYRTDKEARRVSNCAAAGGALSPCPFP